VIYNSVKYTIKFVYYPLYWLRSLIIFNKHKMPFYMLSLNLCIIECRISNGILFAIQIEIFSCDFLVIYDNFKLITKSIIYL
jgi:hypothetical protein